MPRLIADAFFLIVLLTACGGRNPAAFTPTIPKQIPTVTLTLPAPFNITPTIICFDGLAFLDDITIPDYSIVAPGSTLDKQWLVENTGSCNWDSRYRLRLISGIAMGASPEQSLFPARAGIQAELQIIFSAPVEAGQYLGEWQAFDAKGIPFGESFVIKIIVQ